MLRYRDFFPLAADTEANAGPDHAFAVADKLREKAAAPMVIGGHDVVLQLSIGVSVFPDNGETAGELLKKRIWPCTGSRN